MESTNRDDEIVGLLKQNQALLQQNNELLEKQERREKRKLIFKVVWYALLLGVPMIAYYYLYSMLVGGDTSTIPATGDVGVSPAVLDELLRVYTGQ
jgi:hypothetical protein